MLFMVLFLGVIFIASFICIFICFFILLFSLCSCVGCILGPVTVLPARKYYNWIIIITIIIVLESAGQSVYSN